MSTRLDFLRQVSFRKLDHLSLATSAFALASLASARHVRFRSCQVTFRTLGHLSLSPLGVIAMLGLAIDRLAFASQVEFFSRGSFAGLAFRHQVSFRLLGFISRLSLVRFIFLLLVIVHSPSLARLDSAPQVSFHSNISRIRKHGITVKCRSLLCRTELGKKSLLNPMKTSRQWTRCVSRLLQNSPALWRQTVICAGSVTPSQLR